MIKDKFAWKSGKARWHFPFDTEEAAIANAKENSGLGHAFIATVNSVYGDGDVPFFKAGSLFCEDEYITTNDITTEEYDYLTDYVREDMRYWARRINLSDRVVRLGDIHDVDFDLGNVSVRFRDIKVGEKFYVDSAFSESGLKEYTKVKHRDTGLGYGLNEDFVFVLFGLDDMVYRTKERL